MQTKLVIRRLLPAGLRDGQSKIRATVVSELCMAGERNMTSLLKEMIQHTYKMYIIIHVCVYAHACVQY